VVPRRAHGHRDAGGFLPGTASPDLHGFLRGQTVRPLEPGAVTQGNHPRGGDAAAERFGGAEHPPDYCPGPPRGVARPWWATAGCRQVRVARSDTTKWRRTSPGP